MSEDKITFAYIYGRSHGKAEITNEQYNQIMSILYGDETEEA